MTPLAHFRSKVIGRRQSEFSFSYPPMLSSLPSPPSVSGNVITKARRSSPKGHETWRVGEDADCLQQVMNKTLTIFCCAILLVAAGCFFGDPVAPPRTVALNFPAPAGQSKVSLSVSDTQVQEALRVIDIVLTADGLTRDTKPPAANDGGLIASYARDNGTGLRSVPDPNVYLKGDRLEIIFFQFWNHSGHISEFTKKSCNSLRKELSSRYGSDRVKIE
jgi:hypothetical protein